MLLLALLVIGLFTGWLAHLILYRDRPTDWGRLLVAGWVGSFVGGLVLSLLFGDGLALRPSGIIGSVIGAVIVLFAWEQLDRRAAR